MTNTESPCADLCFTVVVTQWKLMGHIKHRNPTECVVRLAGGAVSEELLVYIIHDVTHTVSGARQGGFPALPLPLTIIVHTPTPSQH